ncbi:peptidoglycan DD-metalloendopeptidase family protein [Rhizobium sp. L1K21]|uniref:peptidoglycan DD-metalloendopeptidase family protein n=1 Tax=Rhizobium sp. L1K21 TaxID=2954933 RepID=UPI0020929032|nr:peptidoglycan DD-metalloendopeptidase family protein [Rhizobium sp. L1K21]MCO6186146.1 peptidoglycan DD-metalloendopeptidase family protein [Rhizobium sp. L1K21]
MPAANGSTATVASSSNIYDPIRTGTVVKRQPLSAAGGTNQVMPQERPVAQAAPSVSMPDPVTTASTPRKTDAKAQQPQKVALNTPVEVPLPKKAPTDNQAVMPKTPEVENKQAEEAKSEPSMGGLYEVKSGDSLGRIAANHGTTINALRAANGLTSDNIRIGQKLKVPGSAPAKTETVAAPAQTQTADNTKTASTPKEYQPPVKQVSVEQAEKNTKVAVAAPEETGIGKYRWPARGAIIAGYGANVDGERNDGIDISLPEGSPVKAAENGVVIYSGDGLKKLGNTVLVRHADGKVTVYAHLKTLNVQRGNQVKRGQVIASSGMTGSASRPKLHFEVRKDSAPVNPITFLE